MMLQLLFKGRQIYLGSHWGFLREREIRGLSSIFGAARKYGSGWIGQVILIGWKCSVTLTVKLNYAPNKKYKFLSATEAATRSLLVADVGRVVGFSWMIVAGSWSRSSRWSAAGRSLKEVVGKSMSRFRQYVGLTVERGGSIWLLARSASRTWARCCNARTVRNSESYVDWMLHCWSVVVEIGVGSLVA